MTLTARIGTLAAALALVGCADTHARDGDARTDLPDGGSSSCGVDESASLGGAIGFRGASLDATPRAATVTGVEANRLELEVDGEPVQFHWPGPSIADVAAVGDEVRVFRENGFDALDAAGVGLRAWSSFGFTGFDVVGAPQAIPDGPSVTLVEGCTFREASGGCGQPPGTVTVYDLAVDGETIAAGERAEGDGYTVFHHGAAQFPGYGSDMCVVEAGFGAKVAARVRLADAPATCADVERAYRALLGEHAACESASDCVVLTGQCGVGLGGCYEVANADLSPELEALGRRYQELGCTSGVCDCAGSPRAFCNMGGCGLMP